MAGIILVYADINNKRPVVQLKGIVEKTSAAGLASFLQGFAGPILRERAEERFRSEGDEASGRWKPLAASTINRRESKGYVPIKINDRQGKMREFVENAQGRVVPSRFGALYEWPGTPQNRTTGKKLKVAQQGLSAPYTVPRPVVAISAEDALMISAAAEAWFGLLP